MKNDKACEYCMYRQVPSSFQPCLGCKNNMDSLKEKAKEKEQRNKGR